MKAEGEVTLQSSWAVARVSVCRSLAACQLSAAPQARRPQQLSAEAATQNKWGQIGNG